MIFIDEENTEIDNAGKRNSMKFVIRHEIKGRIRIHAIQNKMSCRQADTIKYYLENNPYVVSVKVQECIQDVVIRYNGSREEIIKILKDFDYGSANVPQDCLQHSVRNINGEYWDKLVNHIVMRGIHVFFIPYPIRGFITAVKAIRYIRLGFKTLKRKKLEVPVLDAAAISVSMLRGDFKTAGSVMFLLGIGEILEEWTHKKSVGDLAKSMSLNIGKVWVCNEDKEFLTESENVNIGDNVKVHMGSVIPFDGVVVGGEAMVNQSSLTGESVPVRKTEESFVYAGTAVEEGEIILKVKETGGASKFEKIVTMIEETEKLKSSVEGKAEHLADKLVPYTLAGTVLAWILTGNVTKALSVLMVDFSCALKLAIPISVLSAMKEAGNNKITVKGGKYLEAVAQADTIVFDKTGTLTKAQPEVAEVISFNEMEENELLRIAACLEEHFPHSMAKAVVDAAKAKNLEHEELHSKVEYIVAHGISSTIGDRRIVIGSHHFIFEDEKCNIDEKYRKRFDSLPSGYSYLYMAMDGCLASVICIQDPLRKEAAEVIESLRNLGISKIVMMTGDSERTAKTIAKEAGVDEYYSEVLPEDKAKFIESEKAAGRKVIMIGDGINDSPALSAADIGIAISDGAEIAREISDVTISSDNLYGIVTLKSLSDKLMERVDKNYKSIVAINGGLIALGLAGIIQPTSSALLHNASTLAISLKSMNNLL